MSPHSSEPSSDRDVEATTNDELSLDKETLKDLDPRGDAVAGQLGNDTATCPSLSCVICTTAMTIGTIGNRAP